MSPADTSGQTMRAEGVASRTVVASRRSAVVLSRRSPVRKSRMFVGVPELRKCGAPSVRRQSSSG
jgi:hypothetical protein